MRTVCHNLILVALIALARSPSLVAAAEADVEASPWGIGSRGTASPAWPTSRQSIRPTPRPPSRPTAARRPISWPGSKAAPLTAGRTPDSRQFQTHERFADQRADAGYVAMGATPGQQPHEPARLTGSIEPAPYARAEGVSPLRPDRYAPPYSNDSSAPPASLLPSQRADQPPRPLDAFAPVPGANAGSLSSAPVRQAGGATYDGAGSGGTSYSGQTLTRRAQYVAPQPQILELTGATIIARVGSDVIVASDVMGVVNAILAENADKITPEQLPTVRDQLIRQRLEPLIDQKLVVADFRSNIDEDTYPLVLERLDAIFEEKELKRLMRTSGARSRAELEQKLADLGMSLERQKKSFVETTLARQWMQDQMNTDDEITHAQMLAYYHDQQDAFAIAGKARWQHVMVRFDRHPSKEAAWRRLAELGNHIWSGTSFEEVARQFSDGSTAAGGGQRDWTTEGSLVSEELNQALMGLPIGAMSRILKGPRGYHVVRVLERKDAGRVPFVEAQVEIKKNIREQRSRERTEKYLAELHERIPTWTMFDEPGSPPSVSRRSEFPPRR